MIRCCAAFAVTSGIHVWEDHEKVWRFDTRGEAENASEGLVQTLGDQFTDFGI